MKKEEFMKVVRSKAKETLTDNEVSFFEGIGEAVETAFTQETAERNKQLTAITEKLGIVDEGKTIAEVIRNLATAVDTLEAKTKRSFTADERFKLKSMLESKKDLIQRARKSGEAWEIEVRAKRAASALMTNSTILTGAQAINSANVFDDLEVTVIQYPKDFILDMINSRQVSKYLRPFAGKSRPPQAMELLLLLLKVMPSRLLITSSYGSTTPAKSTLVISPVQRKKKSTSNNSFSML